MTSTAKTRIKINKWDWLLIIGLVLAPMTGLRTWKVGPGELLCFLWSFRYITKINANNTTKFFTAFIAVMCIGSAICYLRYPDELDKFGILTWIYLGGIAVSIYIGLSEMESDYIYVLFYRFAIYSVILYILLYLYGVYVGRSFFGAPLWFAGRYTGGGTNPHQIACMMCGLFFVFLFDLSKSKMLIADLSGMSGCLFILAKTKSSTGYAAVAVGLLMYLYFILQVRFPQRKSQILLVEAFGTALVLLLFFNHITDFIYNWISEDTNGIGRLQIFSTIGTAFKKSPIFGLGPGIHAYNGIMEFHNTYLEILAATGIIGCAVFIVYSVRLFRIYRNNLLLATAAVAMYSYGIAGFAMRRLTYWGIIIFINVLCEKQNIAVTKKEFVIKDDPKSEGAAKIRDVR